MLGSQTVIASQVGSTGDAGLVAHCPSQAAPFLGCSVKLTGSQHAKCWRHQGDLAVIELYGFLRSNVVM